MYKKAQPLTKQDEGFAVLQWSLHLMQKNHQHAEWVPWVGKLDIRSADGHHVEPSGYVKKKKAGSAHIMTLQSVLQLHTSHHGNISRRYVPSRNSTSCLVLRYATSGVPLSLWHWCGLYTAYACRQSLIWRQIRTPSLTHVKWEFPNVKPPHRMEFRSNMQKTI